MIHSITTSHRPQPAKRRDAQSLIQRAGFGLMTLVTFASLAACGSNGQSSAISTGKSVSDPAAMQGRFVDAPVQGLGYSEGAWT